MADLDSWHDTPTTQAIIGFAESAAERIPAEERVAVFDNDGTLWRAKPIPIQLDFILRRFVELAEGRIAPHTSGSVDPGLGAWGCSAGGARSVSRMGWVRG